RDGGDRVGEVHLAVVLRLVTDLRLGAGQAPEAVRVAADPVDDQERNAVLVRDVRGLDHAYRLLNLIAPREIGTERPVHHFDVPGLHVLDIVVTRAADAPLDHFQLAAVDLAGGEDEAEQLVGRLGPAV